MSEVRIKGRPDPERDWAIKEQLDALLSNRDQVQISTEDLVRVGVLMCNSLPEEIIDDPKGLIWFSPCSIGGRETDGVVSEQIIDDVCGGIYSYDGYPPDSATFFRWTSATSGATITARSSLDGAWDVAFEDPHNKSTMYANIVRNLGTASLHDSTKEEICWPR